MDLSLRNLKDFLTLYNKVTELCFSRCVVSLSERDLLLDETACVNNCATKFALFNQKMMNVYVELQTEINQRRIQEAEEEAKKLQQPPAANAPEARNQLPNEGQPSGAGSGVLLS